MSENVDFRVTSGPLERLLSVAPEIEQQLDLLRRTVEENERALNEARAALESARRRDDFDQRQLSVAEAEAVAGLRRARFAIRAQTQRVNSLVERLPNTG